MKVCKQCGRSLDEESFRLYVYQSNLASESGTPRRNTVCKECENFNQRVNIAYRSKSRSEYQQNLVDEATEIYKVLLDRGLEPIGALAKAIAGKPSKSGPKANTYASIIGLTGGNTNEDL